jgi:hypothetical protein
MTKNQKTLHDKRREKSEQLFDDYDFTGIEIAGQCGWSYDQDTTNKVFYVYSTLDDNQPSLKASFTVFFEEDTDIIKDSSSLLVSNGSELGFPPQRKTKKFN